jgi:O-antigen ligase
MEYWAEKSLSFKRMVTIEESGGGGFNTLSERLNMYTVSLMRLYRWQGLRVPFIGAGFYVAPHTHPDGTLKYRTGYGVHNSYLFALEQGGLGAFILFIAFLIACHKNLKIMRKPYNNESDRSFATGMHAFFFALLIVMLPGQIFWHGFQKVNFNTYLILLFMIACMNSYFWENEGTSFYNDTLGDNDTFGDNKTLVDNEN